jgi:hypothetical protein
MCVEGRGPARLAAPAAVLLLALAPGCTEKKTEPVGSTPAASTTARPASRADASADAPGVPVVLPLLPGEAVPTRGPNYFEPHEMGATGIGSAFESCGKVATKTGLDLPSDNIVSYCFCLTDAWRTNTHAAVDPVAAVSPPTPEQKRTCALADGGSPFAVPFPKSTPELYKAWQACLQKWPSRDHGVFCGCYVDGQFEDPQSLFISMIDQQRCELADQYWWRAKTHLTVRQFRALLGGPVATALDAAAPVDAAAVRDR